MMKKIMFFWACVMALSVQGCMEDLGNYDYVDAGQVMPVTISGLSDVSAAIGSVLAMSPTVENAAGGDYAYEWSAREVSLVGAMPTKTVLSAERDLNVTIQLNTGVYYLSLEVKDRRTGVYVREEARLTVTASDVNAGWYVLKDQGGYTDIDYFKQRDGVWEKWADVLSNFAYPADSRPKGTAIKMAYQSERYSHIGERPDGTTEYIVSIPALHVVTSEDIRTFDASRMVLLKTFEEQFYAPLPATCAPQSIYIPPFGMGDIYMINDGKLYSINGMDQNAGKYAAPRVGEFNIHKDLIITGIGLSTGGALAFDQAAGTFLFTKSSPVGGVATLNESDGTGDVTLSPTGMDYSLENLMLTTDNYFLASGLAVMKNKTTGKFYVADINFNATGYPFFSFNEVPEGRRMPLCEAKGAPSSGSFIYFGDGNKLSVYRNFGAFTETLLKTFPEDETISYIENRYQPYVGDTWLGMNYLVVLTNSAAGWKLYAFEIIGRGNPEFESEPVLEFSGTGTARQVLFRPI